MSKILLCADLHLHPLKKNYERLQDCINVLEWIFTTAKQKNVKSIIVLGDLFHDRQKIDIPTYQKTFETFIKYLNPNEGFNVYLLLGNHDLWYLNRWDINSVFPLSVMPNVTVVDKPSVINIENTPIGFLPYTNDPITDLKKIRGNQFDILCGHIAINGAVLNVMHDIRSEVSIEHDGDVIKIDAEVFRGLNHVFLGHYHDAQMLDFNIEYIGSPLQLSFGEAFQHKHILIFDTNTHEKEYVRNTFSPQHFIIPIEDLDKYELKNNFIKIIVDDKISASDIMELRNNLTKKSIGGFQIAHDIKPQKQKQVVDDAKSILLDKTKMMEEYIKQCRKQGGINNLTDIVLSEIWKKITERQA